MASCDEFEIDLERLAGGSLPEDRRAALEEHLSTCEGCRRYQATVAETTQALRTTDAPAWAELRARVAHDFRRERVELDVTAGALAGVLGPILFWAHPALGVGAVAYIAAVWWFWLRRSKARRTRVLAEGARADFFAALRRDLDGEITRLRWSTPIMAVCLVAMSPVAVIEFSSPRLQAAARSTFGVMVVATVAVAWWNHRRLQHARAQRLELDGRP